MRIPGFKNPADNDQQTVLGLRWILIIATSYLLLFHRPLSATPPIAALFLAAYLASNIVAARLLPRVRSRQMFEMGIVAFDAAAVSVALLLTQDTSSDFFLLYFVVMFIGTLSDRLVLVVVTAVLVSVLHLYTTARLVGLGHIVAHGHLIRIPFLFVVALFFGHLVQRARSAEHEAKEAREHERLRTDFVGGVVHDLKNPIAVIQGLAEIILDDEGGSLADRHAEPVRRIHATAQRMLRLSLNLLDAARIEAGRLTLDREPRNLAEIIHKTLSAARPASDLKDVSLGFVAHDAASAIVDVDAIQMERVLLNLLDNAIKYTPAGGSVVVALDRCADEVVVSVSDSGPGVPAHEVPTLFEQYKRNKRGEFASSGLGLFIVKAIVEAHGGTVAVTSAPSGGARFIVRLPGAAEEHRSAVESIAPNGAFHGPEAPPRSLSPGLRLA